MEKRLPDYLNARYNAAPAEGSAIVRGDLRLTVITSRLIRIEKGAFTDAATQAVICRSFAADPFTLEETDGELVLRTEDLELRCRTDMPLSPESFRIRIHTGHVDCVWHWGERPKYNLLGTTSTLDEVNGDCALEEGICSRDGFGLLDDTGSALFTDDGWFEPHPAGQDLYFFGYGHDYTACVQDYCRLTGAPSMLPAFVLGNWWSRYHKYTAEEYLDLMDDFRDHDIPLSVGIVDMDWHLTDGDGREYWKDGWTGYTWNRDLFPDPPAFLKALKDRNLKTALNLHPAQGVRKHEDQYPDMARARGIDPKSGRPVPCAYLDPSFYQPYMEILHFPMEKDGVDFWWMDWQQGTDYRSIVGEEAYEPSKLETMNPLWLMNHMHYLTSKRDGRRGLIFSRYCGHGSQRYPIGFSGDSTISWESLAFQPYFTANASNVGYGWWSHDIGGHHRGYRDDELTVRWIQLGVMSPVFRLHSTSNIFLGREPWNYDPRSEAVITRWMRLRHQLFPYLYTMNRRASTELIPLIRPMYHIDPEVPEAYQVPNEYWFGSQMIAAPITAKSDPVSGFGCVRVWLPEGLWTDLFTGTVYHGPGTVMMHRRLESIPVLLKAGAIVPMQAHETGKNSLGGSENLTLVLAPGANGSFTLYEDDGKSEKYHDGAFAETLMTFDWGEESAVFTVYPATGDLSLVPSGRRFTLALAGFNEDTAVSLSDGTSVDTSYDQQTHRLIVKLPVRDVSEGIRVLLHDPAGIVYKAEDTRARCVDLLMRAQCTLQEKDRMLDMFDRVTNRIMAGEPFEKLYHLLSPGYDDLLYSAERELVREWYLSGHHAFRETGRHRKG